MQKVRAVLKFVSYLFLLAAAGGFSHLLWGASQPFWIGAVGAILVVLAYSVWHLAKAHLALAEATRLLLTQEMDRTTREQIAGAIVERYRATGGEAGSRDITH